MVGPLERRDIMEVHSEQGGVDLVTVSGPTTQPFPFSKDGKESPQSPPPIKSDVEKNTDCLKMTKKDGFSFNESRIGGPFLREEGFEELDWLSEGLGMEWWTSEEGGLNEGQEGVGRGIEG